MPVKKLALFVISLVALGSIAVALGRTAAPAAENKWDGWVSDEKCGAKGADPSHAACAVKCVTGGAAIIFIAGKDKTIYKVENQDALKDHVGHYVNVTGTLNGDTLHVDKVTMLKQPKAPGQTGEHGSGN
jgi:hypothetical protein